MSVSDPLIKELKGYTLQLLENKNSITDDNHNVNSFCECLERILQKGLLTQFNTIGICREPESWHWLESMAYPKYGAPYSYQSSVDTVKKCDKVKTNIGRTRLLIRSCLSKRCMHIPFQLLIHSCDYGQVYSRNSIIGDEILCEILISVLLLASRFQFNFDLSNSRFLDNTWLLPYTKRIEFVPCKELGLSLVFVNSKAIAVEIQSGSIAAEDDQIEVGDVLDELNGFTIIARLQGCLGTILKKSAGQPVTVCIIKAVYKNGVYPPLYPLLRQAGLNPSDIESRIKTNDNLEADKSSKSCCLKQVSPDVHYIGCVPTGDIGDVKQIRKAINTLLSGDKLQEVEVKFECQDMGIIVSELHSHMTVLKHSYMQISSCGCTVDVPHYFAYIAEDKKVPENRFVCYIFSCKDDTQINTLLSSIGQGFKRTHYAV